VKSKDRVADHQSRGQQPRHAEAEKEIESGTFSDSLISGLAVLDNRYLWLSRRELRDRVRLRNADRERLRAYYIPPYDMTDAQLEQHNRAKKRARNEERRRKAGAKPRSIYLTESKSRSRPWEALNISRAKFYRLGLHRETSPRQVQTRHQLPPTRRRPRETTARHTVNKHCGARTSLTWQWESQFLQEREQRKAQP
jgi:hypothetical protein